ncbi:hypothetical protein J6590_032879 [Homalodisca vitripennis]|nr:hypothetical protein J6590_032879 [Homalodisca vitripennis]
MCVNPNLDPKSDSLDRIATGSHVCPCAKWIKLMMDARRFTTLESYNRKRLALRYLGVKCQSRVTEVDKNVDSCRRAPTCWTRQLVSQRILNRALCGFKSPVNNFEKIAVNCGARRGDSRVALPEVYK